MGFSGRLKDVVRRLAVTLFDGRQDHRNVARGAWAASVPRGARSGSGIPVLGDAAIGYIVTVHQVAPLPPAIATSRAVNVRQPRMYHIKGGEGTREGDGLVDQRRAVPLSHLQRCNRRAADTATRQRR